MQRSEVQWPSRHALKPRNFSLWLQWLGQIQVETDVTTTFSLPLEHGQTGLRLLVTTDMHGHLLPYDYHADKPDNAVGLARVAELIRACRNDPVPSLLLDNGDFLQGTLLTEIVAGWQGAAPCPDNPIIAAMNALNYDAASLGNHEFNFGLDYLQDAINAADFPVLSANVFDATAARPVPLTAPWAILDKSLRDESGASLPIRIGLIGFTPPQVSEWDSLYLGGRIETTDILDAARATLPALRAAGADLVIALCHGGLGSPEDQPRSENAALPLAALPGIDVVLMGHTHELFPDPQHRLLPGADNARGTLHGKPAINAGANGSHLGVIDLALQHGPEGWRIAAHRARNLPICARDGSGAMVPTVCTAPDIAAIAQPAHGATLTHLRQPVGQSAVPLQSYFARVAPDPTVQLVADAQRRVVARALRGTPWQDLPILSAAAPFKAGGRAGPNHFVDIPPGPLAMRNASELYLYPNSVCAQKLSGAQLRLWLEQSASAFLTLTPGATRQPLLNPDVPSYNFDVIDGVTYEIDLTAPPRFAPSGQEINPGTARIRDLRHDGQPVRDDQSFILATNSYRAGGGGNYRVAHGAEIVLGGVGLTRQAILQMFQGQVPVRPDPKTIWRFRPVPGATAIFETGQGAPAHQHRLTTTPVLGFAETTDGFLMCEIDLDARPRS